MNQNTFKEKRRGGYYYINYKGEEVKLPSVTSITDNTLPKDGLMYWFGKIVAQYIFDHPEASLDEAMKAPNAIKNSAGDKGARIHSLVEAIMKAEQQPSVITADEGYLKAINKFFEIEKIKPQFIEVIGFNLTYGYAGRIDLIGQDGNMYDWKTGKDVYLGGKLQQIAYKHFEYLLLGEEIVPMPKINDCFLVHLQDDGNYAKHLVTNGFEDFLAVKKVWEILHR